MKYYAYIFTHILHYLYVMVVYINNKTFIFQVHDFYSTFGVINELTANDRASTCAKHLGNNFLEE